ncbi:MAG: MFS transporter [Desulfobacterales bacterium]
MSPERRAVWGWALYDWANSAFATTVMAGFFPVFFKQYWAAGVDAAASTAMLGFTNAAAGALTAALAPVLGAAADVSTARKRFLAAFAYLGVASTAALYFIGEGGWPEAAFAYAAGILGFAGANVFYDALLPAVAPPGRLDAVSSLGFALGYLGGGLLFLANAVMTLYPAAFGLAGPEAAVRLSFLTVALWWGGFTGFLLRWVPEPRGSRLSRGARATAAAGFRRLAATFRNIRGHRPVLLFLAAYWCYIDGVDTIIRMAVDYGLSLGFAATDLITALLVVQFVGFPAALAFGRLGTRLGPRRAIFLGLGAYMGATLWGAFLEDRREFYALAVLIGLVQGGVQALSRSLYARLVPEGREAEFFGFYNMIGKFAAILGPALMGAVGLAASRMLLPDSPSGEEMRQAGRLAARLSIASILLLFAAGAGLLYFVREPDPPRGGGAGGSRPASAPRSEAA